MRSSGHRFLLATAWGINGPVVIGENDHGPIGARALTRLSGEELAVHRGDGADAPGVALPAPDGHGLVHGAFCGLQVDGPEEVGDLAGHVEGGRDLGGRAVRVSRRSATAVRMTPRLT